MKKRVLVVSASAGAGHVRAADAVCKVFGQHPDVAAVEHWDMLKYTNRVFRHLYGQLYLELVNKAPSMLGWFYDLSDTPYHRDRLRVAFEKLNASRLNKALRRYSPDLLVCTHFTPAAIFSWLHEHAEVNTPPAIIVTDFDCHAMWFVRRYLQYFVAIPETKAYLQRVGVAEEKVVVTGIRVDPIFETPLDPLVARKNLGIATDRVTILVSAGGFGVGPVERLIEELLRIDTPIQLVAIAGRSEELKGKLDSIANRLANSKAILVPVGYTTKMDEYMAAADLLVGKAGGLTSSEALARGLPLCIVNPIPGQEERNSDHLLEAGAAIRCNNLPTLAWKLERLLADQPRFNRLRERSKSLGRPAAARQIVHSLMQLIVSLVLFLMITTEDGVANNSTIHSDETVVLFPSLVIANSTDPRHWMVNVHGWIFELEEDSVRRNLLLAAFCQSLQLLERDCDTGIFRERAKYFLVDNERGKRVRFSVGSAQGESTPSGKEGHFKGHLAVSDIDFLDSNEVERKVLVQTKAERVSSEIVPILPNGITVISDIDDTIKLSHVADRSELLRNTFLRPFKAAPGMVSLYQALAKKRATFAYVSASPWQLYPALEQFLQSAGFPIGTLHLKEFRWKDSRFFDLFIAPEKFKSPIIESRVMAAPQHRYVLIGDSGEKDPEIYGAIARTFPHRNFRIIIRQLNYEPNGQAEIKSRYQRAFAGISEAHWQVVSEDDLSNPNSTDSLVEFALS